MESRFKEKLQNMPLDGNKKEILELAHDYDIQQEKHQLEIMFTEEKRQLEIMFIEQKRQLEIMFTEKKCELEISNERVKMTKVFELETLKNQLSLANWENIKHLKLVELRSFIDQFDITKLDKTIPRWERFEKFAKKNEELLKLWKLQPENFTKIFQQLYNKLCDTEHPIFNSVDIFEIGSSNLEPQELQIIGFLWEFFPLPPERLRVRNLHTLESIFVKFKDEKITDFGR